MSASKLQALVADNPTFGGFDGAQFESLLRVVTELRRVEADAYLLREGDTAGSIFIIESGRFEVLKKEEDSEQVHVIAVLEPGMSVGEITLLDAGARSASVRALEEARVLVIPIAKLDPAVDPRLPIGLEMRIAFGHELARRLRTSNQGTVRSLREALREAELRASMGRMVTRLLIGLALYMFFLGGVAELRLDMSSTTPLTVLVLLAFATSVMINIRTSGFPASAYGFTTRNWQRAIKEAVLFSVPAALVIVLIKVILIHSVPGMAGMPLFDLAKTGLPSEGLAPLLVLLYAVFVPVQEVVARGIQSALMLYLRGRHKALRAILISTLLFSATHIHSSLILATAVVPLGLLWGWLFWRNPTLIGVSLSHLLLGVFALAVVGFPGI